MNKEEKEYYICLRESEEGEKYALYYLKDLGRRRIYRSSYPLESFEFEGKDINKGLRLFKYKRLKNAQELCDYTNKNFGYKGDTAFKPVKIKEKKDE